MRIVLDTNVLVSGLLSPFGAPGHVVRMVSSGVLTVCYDARVIQEYRAVLLRRKFSFEKQDVDALLDQVEASGMLTAPEPLPKNLPDPDDAVFLEVALAGGAECLVTGNIRHYPARRRHGMLVLPPAGFLEFYRGRTSGEVSR